MILTKDDVSKLIADKTKTQVVDLKSWTMGRNKEGHLTYAIRFDSLKGNKVMEGRLYAEPRAKRGRDGLEPYFKFEVTKLAVNANKTKRFAKTGSTVR